MNVTGRRHFHTLDALRFIAFLKVFFLHLPIFAFPWFNYLRSGGMLAVQFFFVLSSFLISYLVLEEKARKGQFSLRNFFARRVLRIWPLYYVMVAVAYLQPVLIDYLNLHTSSEGYDPELWISMLFLENYKVMFTGEPADSSLLTIMWTLCIEEHFYFIWGMLLYFLPLRKVPLLIAICVLTATCLRYIFAFNEISALDVFSNFDLFACGAIPAYLLVTKPAWITSLVNSIRPVFKYVFVAILIALVIVVSPHTRSFWYPYSDNILTWISPVFACTFTMLLILLLPEKNVLRISEKNILSRLGTYTYGFYLCHVLVNTLVDQIYIRLGFSLENGWHAISFTVLAFIITTLAGIATYHLFEKHFLKLKKYYR